MNFNTFGDLDAVASGNRRLAPWGIYKVKFMGARKDSIQGKADTSKTYDILKIRFEGEDGYYDAGRAELQAAAGGGERTAPDDAGDYQPRRSGLAVRGC